MVNIEQHINRRQNPDVQVAQQRDDFIHNVQRCLDPGVWAAEILPDGVQYKIRRLDPVIQAEELEPDQIHNATQRACCNVLNEGIGENVLIDTFNADDIQLFTLDGYGAQCLFCSALG